MSYSSVWIRVPLAMVFSMMGWIVACWTLASIWRTTSPPRWIRPKIGGFSFSRVPRPGAPFIHFVNLHLSTQGSGRSPGDNSVAQLFGHLLCVRLTQVQLVSDLPVRQVEAHEVQAEHPNPQRLMTSSQNGAGQIIKTRLTIRASIPLAMRLSVIVTITSHRGTVAMGTADAVWPAMLANQLVTFGIVDQRRQSNQRHHGTTPLLVATPSLNQPRHHPSRNTGSPP